MFQSFILNSGIPVKRIITAGRMELIATTGLGNTARYGISAVDMGNLFVTYGGNAGGPFNSSDVLVLDTTTLAWTSTSNSTYPPRQQYGIVKNSNGVNAHILMGPQAGSSNTFFSFIPNQSSSNLPIQVNGIFARGNFVCHNIGGVAFIFGGQTDQTLLGDSAVWTPGSNVIQTIAPTNPPTARALTGSCFHNNRVWMLGGVTALTTPNGGTNQFYQYDHNANAWIRKADFPKVIYGSSMQGDGDYIYSYGGRVLNPTGGDWINSEEMWQYDTINNVWTQMPTPAFGTRALMACAKINGAIWYFGGYKNLNIANLDVLRYTPPVYGY